MRRRRIFWQAGSWLWIGVGVLLAAEDGRPVDGTDWVTGTLLPLVRQHEVPAMGAAIVTGSGLQAVGVAGVRKWGEIEPVRLGDVWHLGSETKAMTATLAALAVEEGKLRWDSQVEDVFPHLAGDLDPDARTITLEQLLSHRAGLVPNLPWGLILRSGIHLRSQRREVVMRALASPPRHEPGAYYEYSNTGYVVVGAMLEETWDSDWEQLVHERVFHPLGMSAVGQGGVGTPGQLDQPWGHTAVGKPVEANGPDVDNPPVLGPAGRVHASLEAWGKFIADQLRGAEGKPGLLKPESYARLRQKPESGDYALGWLVVERGWGGGEVLTHTGCNTMNFAVAWLAPKRDFAVLVVCNQGDAVAEKAADAAASALIQEWQARHNLQVGGSGKPD
jgi:CubicO group peptidase (beta-lactamase class C family)